jgi:hypothetical protein
MKKYLYLGLIVTVLISFISCSNIKTINNEQTNKAETPKTDKKLIETKAGISLKIPSDWDKSKYIIDDDSLGFGIYYKDINSGKIPFINVSLYGKKEEKVEGLGIDMRPVTIGNWTFILSDPSNSTISAAPDEYKTMMKYLEDVQNSFKIYNEPVIEENYNRREEKIEDAYNKTEGENGPILITIQNKQLNLKASFAPKDLTELDSESLTILINAIYARYGYIFKTTKYADYFLKMSWYKPQFDNVSNLLSDVDKQNIELVIKHESLLAKKGSLLKNTEDNRDYSGDEKVKIRLNSASKEEILYITKEALEESDEVNTNCPVRITLKILDSEVEFKSLWNDGVYVSIADFDSTDNDTDIYITETGTDIQCTTYIYKFDGTKLYKYGEFTQLYGDFCYDGKGKIYYCSYKYNQNRDDKSEFNTCYDYRTKLSSKIVDEKLKIELKPWFAHFIRIY